MTSEPLIREIVATVLRHHPPDCIFVENPIETITSQVVSNLPPPPGMTLVDIMEEAFRANELHCPHEGIFQS